MDALTQALLSGAGPDETGRHDLPARYDLRLGHLSPGLSEVFALEDVGEAARPVRHTGKAGVLRPAREEGTGVTGPAPREKTGAARLEPLRAPALAGVS
ncbi:hypothetical protein [Streptomyces sp. ALI-76-A]|jgi:crotonyl-CoA reductase|uniref:hypothetical protein n=1 Tax=Streptomyces sp. ALI-76-A TaxID=3025736 RepID=UPI00256F25BB|nr:hypothetical protein [Streptomyces sp. ALI-76-A]MDL5205475.1 hypothetical protein [Streptomyces sp. ALI-76-A]